MAKTISLQEYFMKVSTQLGETHTLVTEVLKEAKQVKEEVGELREEVQRVHKRLDGHSVGFARRVDSLQEDMDAQRKLIQEALHKGPSSPTDLSPILNRMEERLKSFETQLVATQKEEKGLRDERSRHLQSEVGCIRKRIDEQTGDFTKRVEFLQGLIKEQGTLIQAIPIQPAAPELSGIMEELEGRIKSYADVTRETQRAVLQEQELEKAAQLARSQNIRISGLSESSGEDTQEVTRNWFRDTLKKRIRGRGFGGLGVWSRSDLGLEISVKKVDEHKQYLCLQIGSVGGQDKLFIIVAYFAPWGAPVYAGVCEGGDPFLNLARTVTELQEEGGIVVLGDFNARSGNAQCGILPDGGESPWQEHNSEDEWVRWSQDEGRNAMTDPFLQYVAACNLTILNGTKQFPRTGEVTFVSSQGASLVDYFLVSKDIRDKVAKFSLGEFLPESDHRPLLGSISGVSKTRRRSNGGQAGRRLLVNSRYRAEYEQLLEESVPTMTAGVDIKQIITQVARTVFPVTAQAQKKWFDIDCWNARCKAMACEPDQRATEFRSYMHFIRSKRRRWVREQQLVLQEELRINPQSFWQRLRNPKGRADLLESDLRGYVEAVFGSSLLNQACGEGLPEDWTFRRIVPLYKSGPRREPTSYRTIMIADVFAKLLGSLLVTRLNSWCEERRVRAPVQAGFRKGFSTLDHMLVLRVVGEEAKRRKQHCYVLFVDFAKAFDSVARDKIWCRLLELGVPQEITNSVAWLYQRVWVKVSQSDEGRAGTLGVIQGCPLSPTLFGLIIDALFWKYQNAEVGVPFGSSRISMLIFADDVAMLAGSTEQLQTHITALEDFCVWSGLSINVSKTKWLRIGSARGCGCVQDWWAAPVWGPMVSANGWLKIEGVQKLFLQSELDMFVFGRRSGVSLRQIGAMVDLCGSG
ncbi:hypothetical protein R1sor_018023 [Riccia sorocarpa]|uniref:Reverse transcriptase domain-containing protein n=1 Tax=Riccia sorocarpa TaxID=122646 RepID=A0ABD3ICI7_9MARC